MVVDGIGGKIKVDSVLKTEAAACKEGVNLAVKRKQILKACSAT